MWHINSYMKAMNAMMDAGRVPASADMMALAPMVAWSRMPQLVFEQVWPSMAGSRKPEGERAVFEKMAAVMEGYGAMNAEIAHASFRLWMHALGGERMDTAAAARAWQDIVDASMQPSARRVRANYKRLVGKRSS